MPGKKKTTSSRRSRQKAPAAPSKKKPVPTSKAKRPSKKAPSDMVRVYCSRCGTTTQVSRGGVPLGWSVAFTGGRLEYICPTCARANIRAIEGKLPEEWWE